MFVNKRPMKPFPNIKNQQGIVIVVVILIVTLMVTLLAFMIEKQHLLIRRVTNQNVSEQGFQYAEAVNAWAERVLNDDANRDADFLLEDWATFGQPLEESEDGDDDFSLELSNSDDEAETDRVVINIGFDGLEYSIDDLQAKFNLNNISSTDTQFVLSQKRIFINLLELLDIGDFEQRERLFGALADWVDENELENIDGGGGTESGSYDIKNTPYFAADQALSSVGELKFVEGFTEEIVSQLKPFVTVLPIDNARININTADENVIASLSNVPVVDVDSVTTFLARRLDDAFLGFSRSDIQAAETAIIGVNPIANPPVANMMQVNSQFFQINAKVTLGDYQYCMRTIVLRESLTGGAATPKISVLRREQDTLCKEEITTATDRDEINQQ